MQQSNILSKMTALGLLCLGPVMLCGFTDDVISQGHARILKEDRNAFTDVAAPVVRADMQVNISNEAFTLYNTKGLDKHYEAGSYILTSGNTVPDSTRHVVASKVTAIPKEYTNSFKMRIYAAGAKTYRKPLESSNITTVELPTIIDSNDLAVYNFHFIKVYDKLGHEVYLDTDEVIYEVIPTKDFRVISNGNKTTITDKIRNLTLDLNQKSNLTTHEIGEITKGTNLEGIESAVVEIEEKYNINALFTLALAAHESGYGSSYLARNRNNIFGICAYDSNVDAASGFASKSDCVRYWGKLINESYFRKGRTTLESINSIYASDTTWASQVRDVMSSMMQKIQ